MLKVDNPQGPCNCLVVTSERHIARLIQVNLVRQKYAVSIAWNEESAIEQIDAGGFGLAILYEPLPEIDCQMLIKEIRTGIASQTHVILMSPRADALRDEQCEYRADQYIQVRRGWLRF